MKLINAMKQLIRLHAVLLLFCPILAHGQQTGLSPIPPGRLVKALLINTVESGFITPVVGMVEQDVWWNGKKLIPAHSEIHGTSQPEALRDRIGCTNQFGIVCRETGAALRKLRVQGIVLDRDDPDADKGVWGITDGSYGLKGEITNGKTVLDGKVINKAFVRVPAGHRFYLYVEKLSPEA
jgi:hypothetical protein